MSLGGGTPCTDSPATQSAINDAVAAGASVVAAAGNSAEDAAGATPAGCDNVITVAASDARGHLVTRYSNFGNTVEIMAPGGDRNRDDSGDGNPDGVLSMVKGGYAYYNGTSMAAPHVAGVAALLLAQNPSLTPAEVLQKLQDNAVPRDSTQCPKPCGAGLLNAYFPADGNGKVTGRYQYSAKLVCGVQSNPRSLQLARGFYTTVVNILNPGDKTVELKKKLALAIPPGGQKPGKVIEIAADALRPHQALATDCEDIRSRVFNGQFPAPFIDGFVIIESQHSLNVSAVYSTATLNAEGTAEDHSSIHVEQIGERVFKTGGNGEKPDFVVKNIDLENMTVSCPSGSGSCVTTVNVTIENIGAGVGAGPFNTHSVLDPAQSVNVDHASPDGLGAGAMETFEVQSPVGGNCFDPDCTICVTVDDKDDVDETDESNNQMCRTKQG